MGMRIESITIDGKTYTLKEVPPPKPRTLIFSLRMSCEPVEQDEMQPITLSQIHFFARQEALKTALIHRFPEASEAKEVPCLDYIPGYHEWQCVLSDVQKQHIEWAKLAMQLGLIDAYFIDYGVNK